MISTIAACLPREIKKNPANVDFQNIVGIRERRVATDFLTEDLMLHAALECLKISECNINDISNLVVVTQTAEFKIPASGYMIHKWLKLKSSVPVFEVNSACAGYVHGLHLSKKLDGKTLLLTGDTLSKISFSSSTKDLFGDGASATLIDPSIPKELSSEKFFTDGSGFEALCARDEMIMIGDKVFSFVLNKVRNFLSLYDDETFNSVVFHQANKKILDILGKPYIEKGV